MSRVERCGQFGEHAAKQRQGGRGTDDPMLTVVGADPVSVSPRRPSDATIGLVCGVETTSAHFGMSVRMRAKNSDGP